MLGAILLHHLGKLVVHVLLDTFCGFFFLLGVFTNDFGLNWPTSGESLGDTFGLEAHNCLGQHRVEHATCTLPRLRAVFVLKAQQFQAIDVGLNPLFAVT